MKSRKPKPLTYRPHEEGLRKVFGGLETAVMETLWRLDEATGRDVWTDLRAHRQLAYDTVKTVLNRLVKKGYLTRRIEGRAFLYRPLEPKETFWERIRSEVLAGVFEEEDLMLAHFVRMVSQEDAANLDRLSKLIEAEKKRVRKP